MFSVLSPVKDNMLHFQKGICSILKNDIELCILTWKDVYRILSEKAITVHKTESHCFLKDLYICKCLGGHTSNRHWC